MSAVGSTSHGADSSAHRDAEVTIRGLLSKENGWALEPADLVVGRGYKVSVDGLDRTAKIAVEICAHVGTRSSTRDHKIVSDGAKLNLARVLLGPDYSLFIAFCDMAFYRFYGPESTKWQAHALHHLGVQARYVAIDDTLRGRLVDAQLRQAASNRGSGVEK